MIGNGAGRARVVALLHRRRRQGSKTTRRERRPRGGPTACERQKLQQQRDCLDASITASDQGAKRPGASAALAEPLRGVSEKMVLPVRIELTASPLPRECSTTELRQQVLSGSTTRRLAGAQQIVGAGNTNPAPAKRGLPKRAHTATSITARQGGSACSSPDRLRSLCVLSAGPQSEGVPIGRGPNCTNFSLPLPPMRRVLGRPVAENSSAHAAFGPGLAIEAGV